MRDTQIWIVATPKIMQVHNQQVCIEKNEFYLHKSFHPLRH